MKQNVKAVFFDMDGVLFDSMPFHEQSWKVAFKEFVIDYPSYDVYLNEGKTGSDTIINAYVKALNRKPDKNEIEEIYRLKTEVLETLGEAQPVEGMYNVVSLLSNHQIELWVVTGSSQDSLISRIAKHYDDFFGTNIISGRDVKNGKPHPEPYLKALERTGFKKDEVIVVENAPMGILSAKTGKIDVVAINTGILENKVLQEAGALEVFNTSEDLLDYFIKII